MSDKKVTVAQLMQTYERGAADERERIAKMFDGVVWAYDYRHIAEVIRSGDDPPINTRKGED